MRALILAIVLILSMNFSVSAENGVDENKWKELNQTSDKILQLVREEKLEEAKQLMNYFSKQFLSINFDDTSISMNDLRVVTNSFNEAMGAVNAVSLGKDERVLLVMELRLAIDALTTEHNPLWLNSQDMVMKSIKQMRQAAKEGDSQAFQHETNQFLRQYQMIRPAIMLDLQPHQFQRIEAHIQFINRYRTEFIADKSRIEHLDSLEEDFIQMYERVQKDSADPSLLWVMLTIGGMILTSLSYVGYKKYKAEKKRVKVEDRNE
ncbi:sporulation protein YpjB [Bacillus sp. FJAT-45350]|uniref:sporulation protein YpjB n=1 Tax=Bacillus sp. FJAT-45350 TaxID=2011014 RepID=UPI000BB73FE5|nr:sporulation protein YpjB [Bacillus sp. FJAT-45350]